MITLLYPNISNGFDSVAVTRDVFKKTIKLKQQVKTEFCQLT